MAVTVFWIAVFLFFYTYIGYPLLLWLITRFSHKKAGKLSELPSVTVLIAAYNEEEVIGQKLQNTLQLDYPKHLLQVLVVADGSTDATTSIAGAFPEVKLLFEARRSGKSAAINRAMKEVTSEVVVVTDANSFLQPHALQELIRWFADDAVGGVAGAKKVKPGSDASTAGEGLYWQYESTLKKLEASFYTVIGAAGELFAFRTNDFTPIPREAITDDFYLSLAINLKHKTIAYAAAAVGMEEASFSLQDEWNRKVRIAAGGFQSLFYFAKALHPFLYPQLSFQFFSHRVLRWVVCAPALLLIFCSNLWLFVSGDHLFYGVTMGAQTAFYLTAFFGWVLSRRLNVPAFFQLPFYFVMMHAAMLAGAYRFVTGTQSAVWQKAKRSVVI